MDRVLFWEVCSSASVLGDVSIVQTFLFFCGLRLTEREARMFFLFFGNDVFDGTRFGMVSMSFDFWNAFLRKCRSCLLERGNCSLFLVGLRGEVRHDFNVV